MNSASGGAREGTDEGGKNKGNAKYMNETKTIHLQSRYVRQDAEGLRPFQREALEASRDPDVRLVFVEEPVDVGRKYAS